MAADHYRLPRPVGPSPGLELGTVRPSVASAVRAFLLARARTTWVETLGLVGLWLAAVAIRLPYLWSRPVLPYEVGAGPGLGMTVTPIGAVHELVLAAVLALVGPSPHLPRLVTALQAALTVPVLYVLTRELCRPLGRRRIEETFLMPRLAGLVAAGLLATSAAHVVITSHVARADSFAPLLTIAALFAVERALNTRDGRWLVGGGVLLGLALQAAPSVLAVLPGLLLACWWRGRPLLTGRWAALTLVGLVGTYASAWTPAFGDDPLPLAGAALRTALAGSGAVQPSGELYLDAVGVALVALWRLLASQLTSRPTTEDVLGDPLAWPFVALALLGAVVLVLRGRPLLPLAALSCLLLAPYLDVSGALETDLIARGRYLMPVAVAGMVAIGVAVGALAPIVTGRGSLPRLALGVALGSLVLAPLGGLRAYYAEASAEDRPGDAAGEGFLRVPRAVFDARRYDETVLLDERLATLRLGAGGNALEALRYHLAARGIPTRTVLVTPERLAAETAHGRALIVLERGSLTAAAAVADLDPLLDTWIGAERGAAGSTGAAMLFRAASYAAAGV